MQLSRCEILVLAAIKAGFAERRPRDGVRLLRLMLNVLEEWEDAPLRFKDRATGTAFGEAADLFRAEFSKLLA